MKAIIIGSGFAGMGMGIHLKEAGFHDFVILEKSPGLGGTWRDNSYPGCACDVMSHLYSFSFFPNPNWSSSFGGQQEILNYMERCADTYDLHSHFKFNAEVVAAQFDGNKKEWQVSLASGETLSAQLLITGTGGLSLPSIPNIKGKDTFGGASFHTAEWNHAVDLSGKNVAVIGTGASAIQVVPNIAPEVGQLLLFQRTAPWVLHKRQRQFSTFEKWLFRKVPLVQKAYRQLIYWRNELLGAVFINSSPLVKIGEALGKWHIKRTINDTELRQKVTPNFRLGCKRILLSNDYYPALNRSNVQVITDNIQEITAEGLITREGILHQADVIIYATGFKATEYLSNVEIKGNKGQSLHHTWMQNPDAFLGTTVNGFPNLFMLTGPNTGLGHSSMIYMMEAQMDYIMDAIKKMNKQQLATVEVKKTVQEDFNQQLQNSLEGTVWQSGGCKSWYLHPETGKNVTLWPGQTYSFRKMTQSFNLANYHCQPLSNTAA